MRALPALLCVIAACPRAPGAPPRLDSFTARGALDLGGVSAPALTEGSDTWDRGVSLAPVLPGTEFDLALALGDIELRLSAESRPPDEEGGSAAPAPPFQAEAPIHLGGAFLSPLVRIGALSCPPALGRLRDPFSGSPLRVLESPSPSPGAAERRPWGGGDCPLPDIGLNLGGGRKNAWRASIIRLGAGTETSLAALCNMDVEGDGKGAQAWAARADAAWSLEWTGGDGTEGPWIDPSRPRLPAGSPILRQGLGGGIRAGPLDIGLRLDSAIASAFLAGAVLQGGIALETSPLSIKAGARHLAGGDAYYPAKAGTPASSSAWAEAGLEGDGAVEIRIGLGDSWELGIEAGRAVGRPLPGTASIDTIEGSPVKPTREAYSIDVIWEVRAGRAGPGRLAMRTKAKAERVLVWKPEGDLDALSNLDASFTLENAWIGMEAGLGARFPEGGMYQTGPLLLPGFLQGKDPYGKADVGISFKAGPFEGGASLRAEFIWQKDGFKLDGGPKAGLDLAFLLPGRGGALELGLQGGGSSGPRLETAYVWKRR